jgi:predicted nucleic acid-binding protein
MSDVLVDSSVWIDYLRDDVRAVQKLEPLMAARRIAISGPIYAEVVSGAKHRSTFDRVAFLLRSLRWIAPPPLAWEQIAEVRFGLARQGTKSNLIDLLIAVTALHAGHSVLTRDRDFSFIARVLPVEIDLF